MRSRDISVV